MTKLNRLFQRIAASHINYWLSFAADFTVMVLFLTHGLSRSGGLTIASVMSLVAGFLFAGFVEYVSHRWFFHYERSLAYWGHMQHHENPQALLAMPWFTSGIITVAMWLLLRAVVRAGDASMFMGAVAINYVYYGLLHHLEHHSRIGKTRVRFLQKMWAYHNIHHKLPGMNFGVTTPLWDYVFGTHYRSRRKAGGRTAREASREQGVHP